jgi:hypothetical protein
MISEKRLLGGESEIKELEKLFESLKGQFPELEKELQQLINTADANVVMLYSRRCLEVIITDLCECELKRPRKTEPLKGIIDKLYKEEKVPSHIITSMHSMNAQLVDSKTQDALKSFQIDGRAENFLVLRDVEVPQQNQLQ